MSRPDKCPKCGYDLFALVYSRNRSRVMIVCGDCLQKIAIAIKPEVEVKK